MKSAKLFLGLAILGVLVIGLGSRVFAAGTAQTDLKVSTNIVQNCTISTTAIAFPDYDSLSGTPDDGTGAVTVTCTKGAKVTVGLDHGATPNGTVNQMAFDANRLEYFLYQDSNRETAWGPASGELMSLTFPDKKAQTKTVFGRITAGQDMPAGTYSDTVKATVNF